MVLNITISHQNHQDIPYTYEHKYTNIQVSADVPLVWMELTVLNTNLSRLTKCTVLFTLDYHIFCLSQWDINYNK